MASTEVCSPSRTAQELLLEFKATGRQAPFEEIVRRYAGMVYHVCLRVTKNNHDAEDATQAVFLTLAVQARQEKEIRYIGPWLQQVAHRLSLDLRKSKKRRENREERHGQSAGSERVECECAQQMHFDEMKGVINQEINKLPPKYRVPLVMHYFGGLSREEMARELQCKPGTLGVRLHRAREMLGERLARRGVSIADGTMSLAVAYAVQSVVAEHIITSTCQAASHIVIGSPTSHLVPAQLVALARGAVHSVLLAKVKTVAALLVAMGCAMAAGAEVVAKVTPLDLGLDLQLRIGDWVKENLLPFSAPLRVDATEEQEIATRERATTPAPTGSRIIGPGWVQLDGPALDVAPATTSLLPPDQLAVGGGRRGGAAQRGGYDIGARVPMRLTPGTMVDATPRSVPRHWDGLASQSARPAVPARALPSGSYTGGSLRLSSPSAVVSAVPVVRNDDRGRRLPHVGGPMPSGPWGPQAPTTPDGANGGGNRPEKPKKPGPGNGGGSDNNNKAPQPVQVAATDASAVNLYLAPQPTSPAAPRTPRSPAAMARRSGSSYPGAPTGNQTNVDFASVSGAVFNVPSVALNEAIGGSVLHSDTAFFNADANVTPDISVYRVGDAMTESRYADRTFFRFDPEAQKLVVLGRRSRAQLTGMTVESTAGRLSGWGTVGPAETFDQSGQVVADGLGQPRDLDLTKILAIRNVTENTGANGWYARNGGKLVLPEMRVLPGTRSYTWGEEPSDAQIDLVNSVRVRIRDAVTPGKLKIALAATDRGEVPPLPTGDRMVGLWQMDVAGVVADRADLTVRYDDGLVADLGLSEGSITLWGYDGATWTTIQDGFALDTANNLVRGSIDSVSFFAVAVTPEPGALGVIVGASLLMLRRRRRRQ